MEIKITPKKIVSIHYISANGIVNHHVWCTDCAKYIGDASPDWWVAKMMQEYHEIWHNLTILSNAL